MRTVLADAGNGASATARTGMAYLRWDKAFMERPLLGVCDCLDRLRVRVGIDKGVVRRPSFRGATAAREPGIHNHGRRDMASIGVMDSGLAAIAAPRNDAKG